MMIFPPAAPPVLRHYRVMLSAIAYFAVDVSAANSVEARFRARAAKRELCPACRAGGWSVSRDFETDYCEAQSDAEPTEGSVT